jgi:phage terminase small subunit
MRKPAIAAAIDTAMAARAKRLEIEADDVVKELVALAFSNIGDFLRMAPDGSIQVDLTNLPPEATKVISNINQVRRVEGGGKVTTTRTGLKIHDKLRALELIGKHLGMFRERVDVNVRVGIGDRLTEARERAQRAVAETADAKAEDAAAVH